jgi:hypothetical protein
MDNTKSNDNNSNSDWRKREMGALWKKEGKSQQYYSGFVKLDKGTDQEREVNIVVFLNKMKSNVKAPDLIVYEQTERPSFINHDATDLENKTVEDHDAVPETFLD